MRVYVCGPMSSYEDHNYPAFAAACRQLKKIGHQPVSPHTGGKFPDWDWNDYMRRALGRLLTAEAVCLLPGWEASRGAKLEVEVAHGLLMPTVPIAVFAHEHELHLVTEETA